MNRNRSSNNYLKGIILLLVATLSWGVMYPVAKETLVILDPFNLSLIRYGIGSLLLVILLWFFEGSKSFALEGKLKSLLFRGSIGFAGFSLFAFVGLSYSDSVHAAIIMALIPLITLIISWMIERKKTNIPTVAFICLALIGVSLVITKGNIYSLDMKKNTAALGDFLLLGAAISWAIYTLGAKEFPEWSSLRYTTISACFGTGTLLIAAFITNESNYTHFPSITMILSVKIELIYLIVIAGILAIFSWNNGIRYLDTVNGVLFINLVPVTAFIISIFQNYPFSKIEILGAGITVFALIANNIYSRRS